ncbi:aspartyl/asparaginyl beta-hydroxylase domain-containing protein [Luteimonas terrae]|nr:aspartyl/asparaginyl beta-hydroxylase domain-containing protein [Luteimonas terrae]
MLHCSRPRSAPRIGARQHEGNWVSDSLQTLIAAAGQAAAERRWADAERAWMQVRMADPANVQALYSLAVHAHQRGAAQEAIALLQAARSAAPRDPMIAATLAVVHRDLGDSGQEWAAIQASLYLDPYFLPGLLAKAEFLQRQRRPRAAAAVFRDTLKIAPPEPEWPPVLRRRLTDAHQAVERDAAALADFLTGQVAGARDALDPLRAGRWDEAVAIAAGRSRPQLPQCNQLYVPRLPALPFYDPAMFPWIPELEARTDAIRTELQSLVADRFQSFQPYIAYRPGEPVNQWQALNHSRDWSSFHLWAHGQPVEANLAQCPVTAEALRGVEKAHLAGLCPNVMFSALAPHTHIPPHHGETNARLVAHLPLVVPPDCSFRVGFDHRSWETGKVLVFDDSIEHEARNDSDALRVVLIFDVWNPLLSSEERELVSTLAGALRNYRNSAEN